MPLSWLSEVDYWTLLRGSSRIEYAESYQHLEANYYKDNPMGETTKQGIIMLASYFYEAVVNKGKRIRFKFYTGAEIEVALD